MEDKICEKCLRVTGALFGGMCHRCFQQMKFSLGHSMSDENLLTVIRPARRPQTSRYGRQVDLAAAPDGRSEVPTKWREVRYEKASIREEMSKRGNRQIRLCICMDNWWVADIEVIAEIRRDVVVISIPKQVNQSSFRMTRHEKSSLSGTHSVRFVRSERIGRGIPQSEGNANGKYSLMNLPKTTRDRKALIEHLMLDRLVEEKYEALGEV